MSERLCSIRIRGKLYNYSLIYAHAPTDESDDDMKDEFYDSLNRLYSRMQMQSWVGKV